MNLLEEFCRELGVNIMYSDDYDIEYNIDNSEFNVVDGEEGDYGVKKYYTVVNNKHIANVEYFGGDDYEVEFTKIGKLILNNRMRQHLSDKFNELYRS